MSGKASIFTCFTAALALLATPEVEAGPYRFTEVHPAGWTWSTATSINVSGAVSGTGLSPEGVRAFVWEDGRVTVLLPPGAGESSAARVNGRGEVAGTARHAGVPRAFLYRGGEFVDPTPGWAWSESTYVREDGSVLGTGDRGAFIFRDGRTETIPGFTFVKGGNDGDCLIGSVDGQSRLYVPGAGYAPLSPPQYTEAEPNGINEETLVALTAVQSGVRKGFVYSGGWFIHMTPPGWSSSSAVAVNNRAQVAGWGDSPEGRQGFLRTGGETEILSFPGALATEPAALNDSGQVAGSIVAPSGDLRAFTASPADLSPASSAGSASPAPSGGGCAAVPRGAAADPSALLSAFALLVPAFFLHLRRRLRG